MALPDNQLLLDSFRQAPPTPAPSNSNTFDCCSNYRACSDAKRCVISDRDYSSQCTYRKNLEAGRIFYGKNATAFSPSVYADFLEKYHSLTPDEQIEFQSIVGLFVYWRNCSQEELLFASPGIFRMGELRLLEWDQSPSRLLSIFTTQYIQKHFPDFEAPAGSSRDKAIEQLVAQNSSLARALTDNMVYVRISFDLRRYYVEFYYDFIGCESQPPKPRLPLETDNPDILKKLRRAPRKNA